MKIAVSSSGNNLDSQIDPRFGRCAYFVVADTENMDFEVFDNESIALGGGAGIQAAQFVASKGAKVILTGNVGPNAVKTLEAAGVAVFVGQNGTVGEAIKRYKRGDSQSTSTPNVADHYGMGGAEAGGGVSGGIGVAGGGRGMGGGGRGMGGCGRGMRAAVPSSNSSTSDGDEVSRLKDQVQQLQEQIKSIESKLMKSEA